ncbi:MAG: AraC family transcriptional regulator [Verrucomicrobiae bacterium]|nr:AraC family transcriptional regulator [Verrucomicrobiae bacterium]
MRLPSFRQFFRKPPVKTAELSIHALGIYEIMKPGMVDRPAGTGDYLFMLFHQPVLLEWGGERRWTGLTDLMIWDARQGHYYGHESKRWNHSWMHAAGTLFDRLIPRLGIPLNRPFPLGDGTTFVEGINELYKEVTGPAPADPVIARNLAENLLRRLARFGSPAPLDPVPVPEKFFRLKRQLDEQYARKVTLQELASRVCLSVPHFCAEFKRHFQMSPIDYVIHQRLHHARFLLRDRNLKVAEVAARVGYDDLFYFSRLFKKHFGHSPRQSI